MKILAGFLSMKKILFQNGLTIVLLSFFAVIVVAQFFQGFDAYNDERLHQHLSLLTKQEYLHSGHFISSICENMESEFLQMAFFVWLTMCLYQKGSAESKKLPEEMTPEDWAKEKKEEDFSKQQKSIHPFWWRFYENSMTIVLIMLFLIFFFLHAYGSMNYMNTEKSAFHEPLISYWGVFKESEFWFESLQNWQSEFFSIAIMSLLSVFLRQKGSSQSKKLTDSVWKTGDN
jgi:hypothetical protein